MGAGFRARKERGAECQQLHDARWKPRFARRNSAALMRDTSSANLTSVIPSQTENVKSGFVKETRVSRLTGLKCLSTRALPAAKHVLPVLKQRGDVI